MPSPTFPISSCLTGTGSRTYRFDLDIIANSPRSSHSSTSSTLSESSNSTPLFISTKRNRTPRKRPNQCSAEAAALLSSIYPKLFSATNLQRPAFHLQQPPDDPFPVLLPSFPINGDASLLLHNLPSPAKSPIQPKQQYTLIHSPSPTAIHFQDPGSPDFDAESILDEEVEEGIDSIMGNLSMVKEGDGNSLNSNSNSIINPHLANLMGFALRHGLGFGFGISSNIRGALRQSNDAEWWRSATVAVMDIVPTLSVLPSDAAMADKKKKKKKNKKKKKEVEKEEGIERWVNTAVSLPEDGILKAKLGLKLNYDGVIKDWSGGSPFSGETGFPDSAAELIVSLTDIDDTRDGSKREASVQRYKEKRRNRLFSKKIRYEVRKTNANQRPRMKGAQADTAVREWNKEFVTLKYAYGEYHRRYKDKVQEVADLESQLSGCRAELASLSSSFSARVQEVDRVQAEAAEAHSSATKARMSLKASEAQVRALQARIVELTTQLSEKDMRTDSQAVECFKNSMEFKMIIQERVEDERERMRNTEAKTWEKQGREAGYLLGFLRTTRLVQRKTGVDIGDLSPSQLSEDPPSDIEDEIVSIPGSPEEDVDV